MLVHNDDPVEVVENKEPWEIEPGEPEGRRNPGIKIVVIPGWRVVSNHRWPLIVVVVVNDRRISVFAVIDRLRILSGFVCSICHDWKAKLGGNGIEYSNCFVLSHC
jgi:hypothetical protein